MPHSSLVEPIPVVVLGKPGRREAMIATEVAGFALPPLLWDPLSHAASKAGLRTHIYKQGQRSEGGFWVLVRVFPAKGSDFSGSVIDALADLASTHLTAPCRNVRIIPKASRPVKP